MKFRIALLIPIAALLTACNFTLAEDVTPPPDYVSPTPVPTLVLVPQQTPNVANGAAIYAEKCSPCHGDSGLGDGAQGLQLPVSVKAFGLADIGRPASPAGYYSTVTRGNIERYMPPFASLNDQQRWDVIAYVLTLHTTPEQIAKGKELFETGCKDCSLDFFKDQARMSAISEVELARLIRNGNDTLPAFGKDFSDDDLWATAAYLRTLSFDTTPLTQAQPAPTSQSSATSEAGTPSAESTPMANGQATAGSEAPQSFAPGYGIIQGSVTNNAGAATPSDLVVTVHGFDHTTGDNAGAQEVFTQNVTLSPDGSYTLENVELPNGRIFLAEAAYGGITMKSEIVTVAEGATTIDLPAITLYTVTTDPSALVIDELHLFFQADTNNTYQIIALYNFHNPGKDVVTVNMTADQQEIPFLKFPTGAQGLGYEAVQDTAPLISLDNGFAMPPNEKAYGILAFSSVPMDTKSITQELALAASTVRIFVPDGVKLASDRLTQESAQEFQGTAYQSYVAQNLKAGDKLTFEVSGTPKAGATSSSSSTSPTSNNNLLIGAGVLGAILILVGVWMYLRNRNQAQISEEDEENEAEFASSEEVLDAIIALDDLHRAKKISEDAYQKRRTDLKETLKGLM